MLKNINRFTTSALYRQGVWVFGACAALAIILFLGHVPASIIPRAVIGLFFLLFFPGWCLTYLFFPHSDHLTKRKIGDERTTLDRAERLTFSVLFSILLSSFVVYGVFNIRPLFPSVQFSPNNLAIALFVMNLFVGALALGVRHRMSWKIVIAYMVFPGLSYGIHDLFEVPFTFYVLVLEFFCLNAVIMVVFFIRRKGSF